jgi:hypothetical protein|uniref:Uncharacterized protein n=1 Tax=Mus musculus TaxID=10090 RepID=Q8BFT5_MOUSE|nr:unnamed protein product [Mus musculus]BAC26829.1 unnamed protein product [Mus musculus]
MHLRSINSVLPGHSREQSSDTTNSTYKLTLFCLGIPPGRRADCKKLRSVRSPASEYDVRQSANASSHPSLSSCKPFLSGISRARHVLTSRIQLGIRGPSQPGVWRTLFIRNILTSEGGASWWCRPAPPRPIPDIIPPLTGVAAG